jgi:hypothetical protein
MATAHGAGLMLWPILMPLCFPASQPAQAMGPAGLALIGLAVHSAAMLAATATAAGIVYEWVGVAVLRRAWLNIDLVWVLALAATGAWLVLAGGR